MTGMQQLQETIIRCTQVFRIGEAVKESDVNGVHVVTIDAFPETPSHGKLVNVHFVNIGFTEAVAGLDKDDFTKQVIDAEHGVFGDVSIDRLKDGPSYIELGGWLGDQTLALQFMGLASHLGVLDVITPEKLGATGELADQMAGQGYVMGAWTA